MNHKDAHALMYRQCDECLLNPDHKKSEMAYSYPYTHPSLNYVYPQAAPHPGFAVGAMNPVTTGVATTNQSAQSVGISVNINRPDTPVSVYIRVNTMSANRTM